MFRGSIFPALVNTACSMQCFSMTLNIHCFDQLLFTLVTLTLSTHFFSKQQPQTNLSEITYPAKKQNLCFAFLWSLERMVHSLSLAANIISSSVASAAIDIPWVWEQDSADWRDKAQLSLQSDVPQSLTSSARAIFLSHSASARLPQPDWTQSGNLGPAVWHLGSHQCLAMWDLSRWQISLPRRGTSRDVSGWKRVRYPTYVTWSS